LVKIGDTPKLPTIQEFFVQMAERQRDEIRKLKAELASQPLTGDLDPRPEDSRKPVPDPWLLHPVRIKRAPAKKKSAKKVVAKKSSSIKKKTTKKTIAKKSRPARKTKSKKR
jgi:hypothetical protein